MISRNEDESCPNFGTCLYTIYLTPREKEKMSGEGINVPCLNNPEYCQAFRELKSIESIG